MFFPGDLKRTESHQCRYSVWSVVS